jgi:hypothetical protein
MEDRLKEINKTLKHLGYEDVSYTDGLMAQRAMILMLDNDLPTSFTFGLQ